MHPIWTLYSRRIFSRLAYWLAALGYNLRDRSLNNRIYLVYFFIFWLVWVAAVFALLGQTLAGWFALLPYSPDHTTSLLAQLGFVVWSLILLWQVSGRSPFVFSEEDTTLICQTPASRRGIGLALYLQGWLGSMLPFVAGAVALAFTVVEWQIILDETSFTLGLYMMSSLRLLSIIIPLQAALLAGLWGFGAIRLNPARRISGLRLAAPAVLVLLAAAWGLSPRWPWLWEVVLFPLRLPLDAAFGAGQAAWLAGLGLSLLFLAGGLGLLAVTTTRMSLSQAAQETSRWSLVQTARSYLNFGLADAILLRQRLGSTRPPSQILRSPGAALLFEKDLLQVRRTFRPGILLSLLGIFGLSLGIFLPTSLQVQLVTAGVWTLTVCGLATRRLRSDLARWWIIRSLPLQPAALLRMEMLLPWLAVVGLGWLAVGISSLPAIHTILAALLLPCLAASATLAAAGDILRHSSARAILSASIAEENVPRLDIWGAVHGLASVLLPVGLFLWASSHGLALAGGSLAVLMASGIAYLNFRSTLNAYRSVGG